MYCTQCGTQLEERHLYCFHCGKPSKPGAARWPQRLTRSMEDKKIAGVCSGFARYFGVDVTLVRVLWIVAVILGGTGLLAYVICWIVMPKGQPLPQIASAEPAPFRDSTA
jgi:phage shock protein C